MSWDPVLQRPTFPSTRGGKRVPTLWGLSSPGLPSFLEITSNTWEAAMGQGRLPAHPRLRAEGQHGHPSFTTDSLLFFFLSILCEVKSLPGIPPSPAPAIATFNQAPSQPQASQTLTPLAVQAAPQVRTTPGSWTEGSGQEGAWSCMRHGVGECMRLWLERKPVLLGTSRLPLPQIRPIRKEGERCWTVSSGPDRTSVNSFTRDVLSGLHCQPFLHTG